MHAFAQSTLVIILNPLRLISSALPKPVTAANLLKTGFLLSALALSACESGSNTESTSKGSGALPDIIAADAVFEADHFSGSGACSECHNDLIDDQGNDVSLGTDWETSTMANSARDPYWRAKMAATLKNHPDLAHEINDSCTRCHAPMANEAMRKDNVEILAFGEAGMLNPASDYYDHAQDGVSCSLCHQIEDTGDLGSVEATSGNFTIATFSEANKDMRRAYGQYTDPVAAYMVTNANFTPVYGAHMSESGTCASCHDLKTPILDANGQLVPTTASERFQEQQTFTEWNNSDYRNGGAQAATCQQCHMPKIETTVNLASAGTDRRRSDFSRHTFLGANTVMLDMFSNFRDELGITATGFEEAIERNREFLQTSADLEILDTRDEGDNIVASIRIANSTGHKLPSGYPSRRVFVHLVVTDESGAVVFESGKLNPDGSIVGADGDQSYERFEPHYTTITSESQVQIYESIMANAAGNVTHSLIEGVEYFKDNRLTPIGFDKNIVSNDVAVVGAASGDEDFNNGQDFFNYEIPVSGAGNYNFLVELVYQPLAFGHLQYLFRDTDLAEVDQFKTIYDATELRAEVISSAIAIHNRP